MDNTYKLTPIKYSKLNKKLTVLVLIWVCITFIISFYVLGLSSNFYIEASPKTIEEIKKIEIINTEDKKQKPIELKPEINGKDMYIDFARLKLSNTYEVKLNLTEGRLVELQMPYTGDSNYFKLRLIKPNENTYLLMEISNRGLDLHKIVYLIWVVMILLLIIILIDYLRLVFIYKGTPHTFKLIIEVPTNIHSLLIKDTVTGNKMKITNKMLAEKIEETIREANQPVQVIEYYLSTFLKEKTKAMEFKVTSLQGYTYEYKVFMQRYTKETTSMFVSKNNQIILLKLGGLEATIIEPNKIKRRG